MTLISLIQVNIDVFRLKNYPTHFSEIEMSKFVDALPVTYFIPSVFDIRVTSEHVLQTLFYCIMNVGVVIICFEVTVESILSYHLTSSRFQNHANLQPGKNNYFSGLFSRSYAVIW